MGGAGTLPELELRRRVRILVGCPPGLGAAVGIARIIIEVIPARYVEVRRLIQLSRVGIDVIAGCTGRPLIRTVVT